METSDARECVAARRGSGIFPEHGEGYPFAEPSIAIDSAQDVTHASPFGDSGFLADRAFPMPGMESQATRGSGIFP